MDTLRQLYYEIYHSHPHCDRGFNALVDTLKKADQSREPELKTRDRKKAKKDYWFLSNELMGMSLYVDRFAGNLCALSPKLDYLDELGVNVLHLMPIFESPPNESDGGYAVSDFRKVDERFGTLDDLATLRKKIHQKGMYLMLDIVLNHTSHHHEWAIKAQQGDHYYQDYYYMYENRWLPNQFDETMPDIFPESAPGNFTYNEACGKWVMTVFHQYQWDLNYSNPLVLCEMVDNILFYANLGVDILRIDAPAFIWKQTGTTSQNLPQAHAILQLIKCCVSIAAPGMALLGEAIVAPKEIMKYFGTGLFTAKECDFAYNATHMALQWDMLASGDTRVMLAAQNELLQKPYGTSWITYTRCHDDIGLGYDDYMIEQAGKNPYLHRKFLKDYYSGALQDSPARGALFSSNPKTGDARISGSLASLCGLEKAIEEHDEFAIDQSINKILLMQAHSILLGGLPMLFYGDEAGYTNDYSYLQDPGKNYDNRWMHRPLINWEKNNRIDQPDSIEHRIYYSTRQLIQLRKQLNAIADKSNITWMSPHNSRIAGYLRSYQNGKIYCVFNFSNEVAHLTWYAFKELGEPNSKLLDHWTEQVYEIGPDHEHLIIAPYGFHILEPVE